MTVADIIHEETKDIRDEIIKILAESEIEDRLKEQVEAERRDTILNLKESGFSNEQIAGFLKIPIEEILRLTSQND